MSAGHVEDNKVPIFHRPDQTKNRRSITHGIYKLRASSLLSNFAADRRASSLLSSFSAEIDPSRRLKWPECEPKSKREW
jgi:hypothetical protein